ncbi:MAG: hypothetical protein IKE21_03040 [Erysipelotrichaceae bacterium]|nr:hypothetical protein [Erysipelotrichaceae bacterium]
MYRTKEEYDRVDRLATDILLDYGICSFPLDMDDLCRRMNINVVPYSAYEEGVDLLLKKSKQGFSAHRTENDNPTIYFNDIYGDHLTAANISSTKGHKLNHIVEGDTDDSEDDLADHFSRQLRCPVSLVIYQKIYSINELISRFGISCEQAIYVSKSALNRCSKYERTFLAYEIDYLRMYYNDPNLDLPLMTKVNEQ